ncbi:hypothetical protein DM02DRAFT_255734 [Periconia macrospinosa]|uniref:Uncharacterized protein n=1 Tax=Periconia macrospinosa TaxID=97972 RepID=A0A2V1E125_9PLEO|nr:hypothetical protein DM02DRAFT_255734 [Periconia macrospinosa]
MLKIFRSITRLDDFFWFDIIFRPSYSVLLAGNSLIYTLLQPVLKQPLLRIRPTAFDNRQVISETLYSNCSRVGTILRGELFCLNLNALHRAKC